MKTIYKLLPNIGLPTKEQWIRIGINAVLAFLSSLVAIISPVIDDITLDEAGLAVIWAAIISSFFIAIKTVYTTLFDKVK